MSLTATNLSVTLNHTPIVQSVSLSLTRGRIVGIIGPNGAGKSTLLRAILGLIPLTKGQVTLDDVPLSDYSPGKRAKRIAYAAQGAPIHWPLTVAHVVALGRIPHLNPWQKISSEDQAIIHQAMQRTDSLHLQDRITTSLSGGERACVMLARAMVSEADYLCADEPTASLDPYHQLQVMEILQDMAAEGHGIALVLHDLSLARRYCDHLLLMTRGKILAEGPPAQVLSDDNFARIYRIRAAHFEKDGIPFLCPQNRLGDP